MSPEVQAPTASGDSDILRLCRAIQQISIFQTCRAAREYTAKMECTTDQSQSRKRGNTPPLERINSKPTSDIHGVVPHQRCRIPHRSITIPATTRSVDLQPANIRWLIRIPYEGIPTKRRQATAITFDLVNFAEGNRERRKEIPRWLMPAAITPLIRESPCLRNLRAQPCGTPGCCNRIKAQQPLVCRRRDESTMQEKKFFVRNRIVKPPPGRKCVSGAIQRFAARRKEMVSADPDRPCSAPPPAE